jgi:mannose/fructose/N-acetylgalactosamine-specific phosphotransferase system component IIC
MTMSDEPKKRARAWVFFAVPVALLCATLVITAWFVSESFVTYAPATIDANAMRQVYLARMMHYGSAIALLNALAIVFLIAGREFARGDPNGPPS